MPMARFRRPMTVPPSRRSLHSVSGPSIKAVRCRRFRFSTTTKASAEVVKEPSYQTLKIVALAQAIPFVGFGFMDNSILIVAGDAIDTQ
jgi:hypothetical protein